MSRKNVLEPIIIAAAQSLSSSFTTPVSTVQFQDNLSYQLNITTTDSTGSFSLQGSDDNINFADTGNVILAQAANDTGVFAINQWPFKFVRLSYTSTVAGTGTVQIILHARTVGA